MGQKSRVLLGVLLALGWVNLSSAAAPSGGGAAPHTHKQARVIKPKRADRDVTLMSYGVAQDGRLWISVTSEPRYGSLPDVPGQPPREKFDAIQVYSPDGELLSEHRLEFTASVINFAPDGSLIAAGQGKLARLNALGVVVESAPTPNIGDPEAFQAKAIEQAKLDRADYARQFQEQAQGFADQLKQLDAKPAAERTAEDESQRTLLQQQQEQMEQLVRSYRDQVLDPEAIVRDSVTVTGVGATADHVFVAVAAAGGRGYEVWRTDSHFANGSKVLGNLLGCCGNLDIQARGQGFVACENTRFKVAQYTRDGEPISDFGKRDRSALDGFGSCCNPMNCLSLANGDFIVAESSVGNIKRFSQDGGFLGLVGKAKISGGCKHVTLGYDEPRDRYYMMNQDKNHICVLVPLAEAPAVTDEERLALEAADGLGKKLIGRWRPQDAPPAQQNGGSIASALSALLFGRRAATGETTAEFLSGGAAKLTGGIFDNLGAESMSWECISQSGNELQISVYYDGVELETVRIVFEDDDHLRFAASSYLPADKRFVRQADRVATVGQE